MAEVTCEVFFNEAELLRVHANSVWRSEVLRVFTLNGQEEVQKSEIRKRRKKNRKLVEVLKLNTEVFGWIR